MHASIDKTKGMNIKKWILGFAFLAFGMMISCVDSEDAERCTSSQTAFVDSVDSPVTGTVGETLVVKVNFPVANGCGRFGRFIETGTNTVKTIIVEANYEGCACTLNAPILTADYEFTATQPGDYQLRFQSGLNTHIIVGITITN